MVMADVVYDVVSGVLGTLFGVAVTLLATRRRTRETNDLLTQTQTKLDGLADENARLLGTLQEKETHILALEKRILGAQRTIRTIGRKNRKKTK